MQDGSFAGRRGAREDVHLDVDVRGCEGRMATAVATRNAVYRFSVMNRRAGRKLRHGVLA
jgi:hypothetical protein